MARLHYKRNVVLPFLVFSIVLAVQVIYFLHSRSQEKDELLHKIQIEADQIVIRLEVCLTSHIEMVSHLRNEWNDVYASNIDEFIRNATVTSDYFEGYQSIGYLDTAASLLIKIPGNDICSENGISPLSSPELLECFNKSTSNSMDVMSATMEICPGVTGITVFLPISDNENTIGCIGSFFQVKHFMSHVIGPVVDEHFTFTLADGNTVLSTNELKYAGHTTDISAFAYATLLNRKWSLKLVPKPSYLINRPAYYDFLVFITYLIVSGLIAMLVRVSLIRRSELHQNIGLLKKSQTKLTNKAYYLEKLLEISRRIPTGIDLKDILRQICGDSVQILKASSCSIYMLDEEKKFLMPYLTCSNGDDKMLPLKKVSFKKWSEGRHANSRNSQATISQGALTDGLENQPTDIAENPTDIPLIVNDDLVGILNINRPGKKLDYDELTMMKTFAAFGSAAFNNVKTMEQLRQAQKMEAVGQLAGGVAHDFNNKLAGIMGFAELAIHDIDNNKNAGENLRNIIERCEKSAHLVQQLLAFSRQQVLKFQTLNLNEVIRKTIELLNKIIGENIDLTLDLQPDIQLIKADMVAIDQVTMNLCINARDAMAGSGELKIATKNTILSNQFCKNYNNVKPGPYVQLTISDTGSGIPDLVKERIFDPFFTTKSVGEGTGLGLSMVYGLVNQHNGLITCDSQSDIGTTFKIYFPVDNATEVLTDKSEIYIMTGGNECILIVEDDFTLLGIIKTTLESLGYSTITANEGCEGLELFYKNQDSIDLIVTDVIMPCQGGLELYDQVINVEENMKFIFITGYRLKADMIKFTESSNVKLLRKPFRTDDLAKKIRFLLDVN